MSDVLLSALSESGIQYEIDKFLETDQAFEAIPLILPASGTSRRFEYRGLIVRQWQKDGVDQFDTAYRPK